MGGKEAKSARREVSRLLHRSIHLLLCHQTQCAGGQSFELGCCEGRLKKPIAKSQSTRPCVRSAQTDDAFDDLSLCGQTAGQT